MGEARAFWIELVVVGAVLIAGALVRYALSTVVPFGEGELAVLASATTVDRGVRMAFVMANGASLAGLYLIARRSAGVPAALAVLLLLQSSLAFQTAAMRISWLAPAILLGTVAATAFRFQFVPWRPPRTVNIALAAGAALLGLRGLVMGASLPLTMGTAIESNHADVHAMFTSLEGCGGGVTFPADRLEKCTIAWPPTRDLDQQEALHDHASRLRPAVQLLASPEAPVPPEATLAVFDAAAAAILVGTDPTAIGVAERVARGAAPTFYAMR